MKSPQQYSRVLAILTLLIFSAWTGVALAVPQFNIVKPSTTGVPGDEVRFMTFDPAGNLWVLGRRPFWSEGGLAMLSADQLPHEPLPGGGFDTGAWKVWSNVHHPIPSPYLNALAFGADGTIWLGSDGGLTRFRRDAPPAEMWLTYTAASSPLNVDEVNSIAIDGAGNVWIANTGLSGNGGLFKFDPATSQWTHVNPGTKPHEVIIGNNGHVLVSITNSGGGFMEFDGVSWVTRSGTESLGTLAQDAQGNVWGSSNYGLWKWNGTSWQNWPTLGGTETITAVGKDRDGVVYVSTWYGPVYKMINNAPVFFADASNIPGPVIGRPNGEIWINNFGGNGTLGTVRHYTAGGQLLERINGSNAGLGDYFINRIKSDKSGNMWFASWENGLTRMLGSNGASDAATHWRNWGSHNDAAEPYPWVGNEPMYSVYDEGNGIFWMGGNGVGRWDSATGQFTGFWNWENSNIDTSSINAIVKRGSTVWVATGGSGVSRFDGVNWTRRLFAGGFNSTSNHVLAMAVDTQNNLWAASEFGLHKFAAGNDTTFTVHHYANTPIPSGSFYDVEADPNGGIWTATEEGLVRFDGTTWTTYTQAATGMPGSVVTDVTRRASDGLIAIASLDGFTWPYTGGVSTFDGTTWTHYTPQNSPLTHWQVEAVEFDSNGNLWASTMSEGVVQILIGAAPVQVQSAVSRKTHGTGTFDINLPLTGEPAVECRSSAGAHTLVVTFDGDVAAGHARVQAGTGAVSGGPAFAGRTMTVNLTGVSDLQTITVALDNVTATSGSVLPNATVSLHILAGDTSGNKTVTSSDVSQVKAQSGQPVTAENFRADVVVSGSITASDIGLAKAQSGRTLDSSK